MKRHALCVLLSGLLCSSISLEACGPYTDTPMSTAKSDDRTPPAGKALLVFIRPEDSRDGYWTEHLAIMDSDQHYIASLGTKERVTVAVTPGPHTYVVFQGSGPKSSVTHNHKDCPRSSFPILVEADAGKVYYLATHLFKLSEVKPGQKSNEDVGRAFSIGGGAAAGMVAASNMKRDIAQVLVLPLAKRSGRDLPEIEGLLKATTPRAVDANAARALENEHYFYMTHGFQTGMEMLAGYDAATREAQTVHAVDGF